MKWNELSLDGVRYVADRMRTADLAEARAFLPFTDMRLIPEYVCAYNGPHGWVFSLEHPIAVLGVSETRDGDPSVWDAWAFATGEFPRIAWGMTRFVKKTLIPLLQSKGARRMQAFSAAAHEQSHRWMTITGAEREATLLRYGRNGEDFHVFRWDIGGHVLL